jgi:hypothetical protein
LLEGRIPPSTALPKQGTPAGNRQGDHVATIHLLTIEMAQQPLTIGKKIKICNSGTRRVIKKEASRDTLVGVETV